MQLKGLIRFFTILLILYSVYELSFTWVVRSHEKKMEAKAQQFVASNYASADSATKAQVFKDRLRRLLDSTKEETVHYGFTGAVSYQKAKEEELNLGLDLQGGINVTMKVELSGLIKSMANNSKDPSFLRAVENANQRQANSGADFISLFVEEYKKLSNGAPLAPLFASANRDQINPKDSDEQVISVIRKESFDAFDRTFRVLQTRIDQFGVAQPNINPDRDRGIITVELPGVQDQERVRKYLQSSANLQFWQVYKLEELATAFQSAERDFSALNQVTGPKPVDTTSANTTTSTTTQDTTTGTQRLSEELSNDTNKATTDTAAVTTNSLMKYFVQLGAGSLGVAIKDSAIVREYLNIPAVRKNFPADALFAYGIPGREANGKLSKIIPLYVLKTNGSDKAPMEGEVVTNASQTFDQFGKPAVSMEINNVGSRQWENITEISYNQTRPIAILLDDIVYSAPVARNGKITGGRTEISGDFTLQEAQDLANILKAGKLPAPAKIVQEQVVGPTLGKDAIQGGIMAFAISFVVIFLLMLVYYNTSGWIANIALILNILFTLGVLTGLGATLTAPGIAALVLTIGMAVDTNVIIYERIKEELTGGKSYIQAINDGYRRSMAPVLDSHITTLMTAIILFSFGLGPVKGFATTQIIGLLLSLFCGILVSRWVTNWFTDKKRHLEYFTPLSKKLFKTSNFKFIEKRKIAYVISGIVLIMGIAALFNGFDQGVEFKGGRSYIVRFNNPVAGQIENIRKDLSTTFGENPIIKTIGNDRQLDITTSFNITNTAENAETLVRTRLMEGLRNYIPVQGLDEFNNHIVGSTTVLPTISDDLKDGAKWATFWSFLIISLYIFMRFRDWRYSLGTIVALLHDVLVTLIVFSFLRHVVPFPLELDQHFIAAVLTVIGFSMNDTIIIFDRIREYSAKMVGLSRETVINKAINDTLSRTIMTSLTVFVTILILFLVGGQVTQGFAFAMLIGVLVGTYSSVFVAAPILVDLGGDRALGKENLLPTSENVKPKVRPANV